MDERKARPYFNIDIAILTNIFLNTIANEDFLKNFWGFYRGE